MTALLGSAYLCESAFSHRKIIKSKYRSTMTDDPIEVCNDKKNDSCNVQCGLMQSCKVHQRILYIKSCQRIYELTNVLQFYRRWILT